AATSTRRPAKTMPITVGRTIRAISRQGTRQFRRASAGPARSSCRGGLLAGAFVPGSGLSGGGAVAGMAGSAGLSWLIAHVLADLGTLLVNGTEYFLNGWQI